MCGIVGFVARNSLPLDALPGMAGTITHRGPDSWGYFAENSQGQSYRWKDGMPPVSQGQIGLGFRRLAILDTSERAAQPMPSLDKRYWIVFNGEIYNYIELKSQLGDTALPNQSDTQVLLELFAQKGVAALQELNGIFAFAIYDTQKKELLLARDPLGVKPLYYFENAQGLFFASELRALLEVRNEQAVLDPTLLQRYLLCGWIPEPDTLIQGIRKVEPGQFLRIKPGAGVVREEYWQLNYQPDDSISAKGWEDLLENTFNQALTRQLRSDVPVAFFLSGGVDSSLLAARAAQTGAKKPVTYTVGFKWNASNDDQLDLQSARKLQSHFGFDHREILLEPSILKVLPQVIRTMEEPVMDPAAICSYLICEAAGKDFRVMMSGQGSDELFGGYHIYQGGRVANQWRKLPWVFRSAAWALAKCFPYSVDGKPIQTVHRLRKFLATNRKAWPESYFLLRSPMDKEESQAVLRKELRTGQVAPFARHLAHFEHAQNADLLNRMLYVDLKTYLTSTNLFYSDKTSMAHSVELRVPYLDLEMVRLLARVPVKYKASMRESKILLKKLALKHLPAEIIHRKKTGFGLPIREWLRGELYPVAQEYLDPTLLAKQRLFSVPIVQTWLEEHRALRADHSMRLYSLMVFQAWLKQFKIEVPTP